MAKSVLYHHGITGMKWGTRNGPPYPLGSSAMTSVQRKSNTVSKWARENISKYGMPSKGSSSTNVRVKRSKTSQDSKTDDKEERHLTDAQKKALKYTAIGVGVAAAVVASAYTTKQLNTARLLGKVGVGKDYVIKEGTQFSRMAEKQFSEFTEGVYTAYRNTDRDLYTGVYGRTKLLRTARSGAESIELKKLTYNASKDLKFPSRKTRLDVFDQMIKESPQDVVDSINAQIERRIKQGNKGYTKITLDDLKYKNNAQKLKLYDSWQDSLSLLNDETANNKGIKNYVKKLKDMGFDGILDENDNRIGKYKSKAPSILFDTTESLSKPEIRDITPGEIVSALERTQTKQAFRGNVFMKGKHVGFEQVKPDSVKKTSKYVNQTFKDAKSLNTGYTTNNLMKDFSKHFSASDVRKVSSHMDNGMSYEEASKLVEKDVVRRRARKVQKVVDKFYK